MIIIIIIISISISISISTAINIISSSTSSYQHHHQQQQLIPCRLPIVKWSYVADSERGPSETTGLKAFPTEFPADLRFENGRTLLIVNLNLLKPR
eukprot:4005525-Amphidinium_carterae.1